MSTYRLPRGYAYDHTGQRTLKMTGDASSVDVNAWEQHTYGCLNHVTLYPSPYMVLTEQGYTKHYYAGTERVAARLGSGGLSYDATCVTGNGEVAKRSDELFWEGHKTLNEHKAKPEDFKEMSLVDARGKEVDWHKKIDLDKLVMSWKLEAKIDPWKIHSVIDDNSYPAMPGNTRYENDPDVVFFYHSDHLGGTSYLTDRGGQVAQTLAYLPYGENWVDVTAFQYDTSQVGFYQFNGKERDPETGFLYYGARYHWPELWTGWTTPDPLMDRYPGMSPYNYCNLNPVNLVDPDGRDTAFAGAAERALYLNYREKVFSDDKYKQVQNELNKLEQSSEVFCVRMGKNISSSSGGGNITYNTSTGQFDINIDGDGIWTDIEKLSHELKHADQYLNRKLTLLIDTKGHATFYNYSVDDELEAYNRQGMFGNTWTPEEVYQVYGKQKGLSWYGANRQYTPSSNDININIEYQKHLGHPRILYHGWENDEKQRLTR